MSNNNAGSLRFNFVINNYKIKKTTGYISIHAFSLSIL